ncbi:hypothetical protein COEREDRAFT_82627 [Coemansia reversa NRRL 1564]|uniref:Zn(2)-C6 fungal-type domain-containing protein n=1 Tax=Coemansia reversa (strain ATCC 12441 / NRRL 1564) TaxID=763665 RepID=A0A2G5B791_COERN|nr:hypothetical protein COEREDRAFT_82627 [Coemansia reversa NRRL 1564]|eukprot:PIA14597.1 hypothetical protein COEREDRAFT_82627 [Coemansia reversa NRRL 1564]
MSHPMGFVHPQHLPGSHNTLLPPPQLQATLTDTGRTLASPQQPSLPPQSSQLPPLHHSGAPWSTQRPAPMQFADAAVDYRHYPYPAPVQQTPVPQPHHFSHMTTAASYMYSHMEPAVDMFSSHYHQQLLQMPRRVRCTQACNHCHRRKARCVRNTMPDGSLRCDNCIREGIVCVWRESRRRGPKRKRHSQDDIASEQPVSESPVDLASSNTPTQGNNAASIANLLNTAGAPVVAEYDRTSGDRDSNSSTPVKGSSMTTTADIDDQTTDVCLQPQKSTCTDHSTRHYVLSSIPWPQSLQAPPVDDLVDQFMCIEDVELREAVLAYYAYFYGFCPILHPSTLLRKVVAGTLAPLLDDALRATTSMFVSKKLGYKVDAEALFSRLVTAITIRPEAPSIDEVCAFQLASIGVSGVRGFVCFDTLKSAVTSLLMQLSWHELDRYEPLSEANTWDEWVEAEIKRRVFWINYKIDSHHASIAGRPPVVDEGKVFVRAPCSDAEWDELSRELLMRSCCKESESSEALPYPAELWNHGSSNDCNSNKDSNCQGLVADVQEKLSRSFRQITPYESFMARIGTLHRDAKASWVQQCSTHARRRSDTTGGSGYDDTNMPLLTPPLLGESPLFQRYDRELREWKSEQLSASDMRDSSLPPWSASFFGGVRHRIFLVRVRYYCINIYKPGVTILLHSANRRSFFTEAQQSIAVQSSRDSSLSPPLEPSAPSPNIRSPSEEAEDQAIVRILNQSLGPSWCQGLVATDIEPESWALCVASAHELADCLRHNSDIPLEFMDMVIPLFLFVGITVLLRQIRRCQRALTSNVSVDLQRHGYPLLDYDEELKRSLRDAQLLWQAIRDMGTIWRIDGIAKLLSNMHIDEVEKAAEQLASMSL